MKHQNFIKIINSFGYESEITPDIETGIKNINEFDLITLTRLDGGCKSRKYIPYIDEWQFCLSDESRKFTRRFYQKGGKMLAFHTSSIVLMIGMNGQNLRWKMGLG